MIIGTKNSAIAGGSFSYLRNLTVDSQRPTVCGAGSAYSLIEVTT